MPSPPMHIPGRLTPDQVDALFAAQRAADPIGYRIHLFLALGACFFAGWSTTFIEWCALPVLVCWAVRMTGRHAILEPLAYDRVLHLLLAWGAWLTLSILWSEARRYPETSRDWLIDTQMLRYLPLALVLWPVMDRRPWLIAALAAGIFCGQLSQLVHLIGLQLNAAWLPYHRDPQRISGWWDPVSGGDVLTAALGLHLAAALFSSAGKARIIGLIGVCATLACTALTGTRGAWIGSAMLIIIAAAIAAWRVRPRKPIIVPGVTLAVVIIAGAAVAWLIAGPRLAARLDRGIEEVRAALTENQYTSDTGARIAMWRWAATEVREHPIIGVGAGGFRAWAQHNTTAQPISPPGHAHAHSWYLHTAATSGLIGLALLIALLATSIWSGLRDGPARANQNSPSAPSAFSAVNQYGPALALIGLACAGLFDSITVGQQPAYMFYLLVALCLPSRPRPERGDGVRP